jgi:D-tagatose-1,6-bisphosphate aldolase subunit GatZ/KbaZ
VTSADDAENTLRTFATAFHKHGLSAAWERVVGLVVQPGVEFGNGCVWDYDPQKARVLSTALPSRPALVYEAHSTDYQRPGALAQMVKDHFAILKVGPALTFAFREAVFALSAIERELLASRPATRLSRVREELEAAMLRNPVYWQPSTRGIHLVPNWLALSALATAAAITGTRLRYRKNSINCWQISPAAACLWAC